MEISEEALQAQQQVVRLQALLEASRQLHSTIELGEVLHIALEIVVRELELDGAFFTTFPQTYGEVPADLQASLSAGSAKGRECNALAPFSALRQGRSPIHRAHRPATARPGPRPGRDRLPRSRWPCRRRSQSRTPASTSARSSGNGWKAILPLPARCNSASFPSRCRRSPTTPGGPLGHLL